MLINHISQSFICVYRGSDSFENISGLFGSYVGVSTSFNFSPLFSSKTSLTFHMGLISYHTQFS